MQLMIIRKKDWLAVWLVAVVSVFPCHGRELNGEVDRGILPEPPGIKLSDLGKIRRMGETRFVAVDEKLAAQLEKIRLSWRFARLPENVRLGREKIPQTFAEATDYLYAYICMAFPLPAACTETEDAFYFSGTTAGKVDYDFTSGIAIMKADGAIWTWERIDAGEIGDVGPGHSQGGGTD